MEFPHVNSGDRGSDGIEDDRHAHRRSEDAGDYAGHRTSPGSRCQACGYELSGTPVGGVCPECGAGVRNYVGPQDGSGLAIASLVLGILSLVTGFVGVLLGAVAVVLAHKVRIAVQEGRSPESSLSMANAGRILGWVGVAIGLVSVLILLLFLGFALTESPFS